MAKLASGASGDVPPRARAGGKTRDSTQTLRAQTVFLGVVRGWPDEVTAERAGVDPRTVRRYRARLRGALPFLLDRRVLQRRLAEMFLEFDDTQREVNRGLEEAQDDQGRAALLRVRTEARKLEAQLLDRLGILDLASATSARPDPSALQRFLKLPLERRRAEAAKRIEMYRERADPTRWTKKVEALEAKLGPPEVPEAGSGTR